MTQAVCSPRVESARGSRSAHPFRYSAAIAGTGQAQSVQEFIGRRFFRHIDPCSSLGRRLLLTGQVSLWCDSVVQGEHLPVSDVLDRLRQQVQGELQSPDTIAGREQSVRRRLQVIESWQAFYGAEPPAGH